MSVPSHPVADQVFKQQNYEVHIARTPHWMPLVFARGDLFATSLVDVVAIFLARAGAVLIAKNTHPRYVVSVSVRSLAKRPYIWRTVCRMDFAMCEDAKAAQMKIVSEWKLEDYAELPALRRRKR